MSQYNHVFSGKESKTFECKHCNSLATITEDGKLKRMIFNYEGIPIIYEEGNKENFVLPDGNLKCDCQDQEL